ncbi:TPA: hypothetical protein N0F65_009795 [Lagenidium giganteum]|uniref:Histone-lysine N-methyltransferase, H3 lysine-79 specific n=1 Tax=Lagenidium giganteum TaxID=4803 RepID=A0AAV2YDU8_9STRA|nr:TPA: hypothetical protein N0F65_009795 [Lagenidium giganteum]
MKDDKKKQYQRKAKRVPSSAEKLQAMLSMRGLPAALVEKVIIELFQEQERDDRGLYRVTHEAARAQTQCKRSTVVDELSATELRRLLTYGEVSVASMSKTVLPLLKLEEDDVFYDLGCGTGKVVVQAALETPCRVSRGIELMQNRVVEGQRALERLKKKQLDDYSTKDVCIVQGDICQPPPEAPMTDATVVFINNVCFGPELMLRVMDMLECMPKLKRVVTLRKLCERHRENKCARGGNLCTSYVHPPQESEIHVSWADKTSVYLYERVNQPVQERVNQPVRELAVKLQFNSDDLED